MLDSPPAQQEQERPEEIMLNSYTLIGSAWYISKSRTANPQTTNYAYQKPAELYILLDFHYSWLVSHRHFGVPIAVRRDTPLSLNLPVTILALARALPPSTSLSHRSVQVSAHLIQIRLGCRLSLLWFQSRQSLQLATKSQAAAPMALGTTIRAAAGPRCARTRGEEANGADVVETLVSWQLDYWCGRKCEPAALSLCFRWGVGREGLWREGKGVDFAAISPVSGCGRPASVGRVEWMLWIVDDALVVEVWEELGSKFVDEVVYSFSQVFAALFELHENIAGARVDAEEKRTNRFEDVHANFSKTESHEAHRWEEYEAANGDEFEWHPGWYPATNSIVVHPPGQD